MFQCLLYQTYKCIIYLRVIPVHFLYQLEGSCNINLLVLIKVSLSLVACENKPKYIATPVLKMSVFNSLIHQASSGFVGQISTVPVIVDKTLYFCDTAN